MLENLPRGKVLIFSDARDSAERLCRWASAAGETPVPIYHEDGFAFEPVDGGVDLVVTDLDTDRPQSVKLLRSLLEGRMLAGVPQLHTLRDGATLGSMREVDGHTAALSMGSPPEPQEFKTRLRLACEIGRLRRELSRSAIRDSLTDSSNRRFLMLRLEQEFSRTRRYGTPLSLVLFNVDRFRAINETYGQRIGDRAIVRVAEVLKAQVRREDIHGRWSSKTFAAILPGTPHRGAAIFASKVRGDAEDFVVDADGVKVPLRISAGISSFHEEGIHSTAELVAAAERALIEATRRGGNRVFIDESVVRADRPVVLLADLDHAWLDLAEDLLSMENYRVIRAESAGTLLETLRYAQPDVLILDTELVHAGEDTTLLEAIHSANSDVHLPIIATRRADDENLQPPLHLSVERFLTKPFSLNVLCTLTRDLIRQAERSRSGSAV